MVVAMSLLLFQAEDCICQAELLSKLVFQHELAGKFASNREVE